MTSSSPETSKDVIEDWTCDSGVAVADWVRIDASSVAQKALATTEAGSHVFGVVISKPTSTTCNIRVNGITDAIFSGLDTTKEYFLSSVTAGAMANAAPTSGFAISLGKPLNSSRFNVNVTNLRTKR